MAVAAALLVLAQPVPLAAGADSPPAEQAARLEALFARLAEADNPDWERVEEEIWAEWSRSGSDAMDLLLERGREALAGGDLEAAIAHFTALVDHAPDFAEGWNARATAYFHAGLYGPSLADIERTLALNPRHFGALVGLGMILEETGLLEDALEAYRRVLAIHPNRPDALEAVERLERLLEGTDL